MADIKGGIEACRERKFGGSMMKLVYCGIDTMAYLSIARRLNPRGDSEGAKDIFHAVGQGLLEVSVPNV